MPVVPVNVPERSVPRGGSGTGGGMMSKVAGVILIVVGGLAAPAVWRATQPKPIAAPQRGSVSLESNPAGATVLIDGIENGKTPLVQELAPGIHAVEFRYRKNTRTVDVNVIAGQRVTSSVDWTKAAARPRAPARTAKPAPRPKTAPESADEADEDAPAPQ